MTNAALPSCCPVKVTLPRVVPLRVTVTSCCWLWVTPCRATVIVLCPGATFVRLRVWVSGVGEISGPKKLSVLSRQQRREVCGAVFQFHGLDEALGLAGPDDPAGGAAEILSPGCPPETSQ